jgi:hypothetical protein
MTSWKPAQTEKPITTTKLAGANRESLRGMAEQSNGKTRRACPPLLVDWMERVWESDYLGQLAVCVKLSAFRGAGALFLLVLTDTHLRRCVTRVTAPRMRV